MIATYSHGEERKRDFDFVNGFNEIKEIQNFLEKYSRIFFLLVMHLFFAGFFIDSLDLKKGCHNWIGLQFGSNFCIQIFLTFFFL